MIGIVDEILKSFLTQVSRIVKIGDDEKFANVTSRKIGREMGLALQLESGQAVLQEKGVHSGLKLYAGNAFISYKITSFPGAREWVK